MTVFVAFLVLALVQEIPKVTSDNTCDVNKPSLFVDYDIGEDSVDDNDLLGSVELGVYQMPFHVFGIDGSATKATLTGQGSLMLSLSPNPGLGGLTVAPNCLSTDISWYGHMFYRYTTDTADLAKINSFLCGFNSESALIFTYSCLRRDDQTSTPEANYQVVFSYGQVADGSYQTILFIIYDFIPEQTDAYIEYSGMTGINQLLPSNNTILAINVTTSDGFSYDMPPPLLPAPCPTPPPAPSVTCSLTADGLLTTFEDQQVSLPQEKIILAEWNPGAEDCKFKFLANFQDFYRWTSLAVGPHKNAAKFFRYIDFNRPPGHISRRGWRCKTSCKGVIQSFDEDVVSPDGSTVYATVKEVEPGIDYVIDTETCSGDLDPDYRLIYNFGANSSQPLATFELASDFYAVHKDNMTGWCVSGS